MHKRLYAVLILFCVILTLSACGEADQVTQTGSDSSAESAESSVPSLSSEDETAEPETSGGEPETPGETGAESSQAAGNNSGQGQTGNSTGSGTGTNGNTSQNAASNPSSGAPSTPTDSTPAPSVIAVTGVTLNQTAVTLETGGTVQLTAAVSPSNAVDQSVTWSSGNTSVATVDGNGKVTAKSAGSAAITVKTANGKTASCTVTVNAPQLKSIYDYEFDIEAIRKELIALGESAGLKHITTDGGRLRTPDNSSWAVPVTASKSFQGANLERTLKDYVRSTPTLVEAYGGDPVEFFTIYVKDLGDGSYTIYFLY